MADIWKIITDFFTNLSSFWTWLTTPLNENLLGDFAPIHIIGIGGLTIILAFWIVKLVNPIS